MKKLIQKYLSKSYFNSKKAENTLVIGSNWFYRVAYFTPLIGFIFAWPAMRYLANTVDWQIYIFAIILVIIFAFNAGTRPILRIEELHMTFFHTITGRITFCYIEDIRYVEAKKNLIIVFLRAGQPLTSPYLTKMDKKKTLRELERRNIPITYTT